MGGPLLGALPALQLWTIDPAVLRQVDERVADRVYSETLGRAVDRRGLLALASGQASRLGPAIKQHLKPTNDFFVFKADTTS